MKLKKPHTCSCGTVHTEIPNVPLFVCEEDDVFTHYCWPCFKCHSHRSTSPDEVEVQDLDTAA